MYHVITLKNVIDTWCPVTGTFCISDWFTWR